MDDLASGGPISDDQDSSLPLLVGSACHCHCDHAQASIPPNITVNIHGTAIGENDIARIIRNQVLNYNRRNGGA